MAKRPVTRSPDRHDIEIEIGGKTHKGYYTLERRMITVNLVGGGSTTTHESQSRNNDSLARIILAELVAKEEQRKESEP